MNELSVVEVRDRGRIARAFGEFSVVYRLACEGVWPCLEAVERRERLGADGFVEFQRWDACDRVVGLLGG